MFRFALGTCFVFLILNNLASNLQSFAYTNLCRLAINFDAIEFAVHIMLECNEVLVLWRGFCRQISVYYVPFSSAYAYRLMRHWN